MAKSDAQSVPTGPYRVDQMSIEDGGEIAMWRAPGPWAVQDSLEPPRKDEGYWAVRDSHDVLVGYCCFGEKARPVNMPRDANKLDVALGIAPQFTGRHLSKEFAKAVVAHAQNVAEGRPLRTAVASWNDVGRHTTQSAGFKTVGVHETQGGMSTTTYYLYEM